MKFLENWEDDRKKSLYQLLFFGIFILFIIITFAFNRDKPSQNTIDDEIKDLAPSIELRELLHKEIVKNYSYAFTYTFEYQEQESVVFTGKRFKNNIEATNKENKYFASRDNYYLFDTKTNAYVKTEPVVYLKEFDYEMMSVILKEATYVNEEVTDVSTTRNYTYGKNKITTVETLNSLTIILEQELGMRATLKFDNINKIEAFSK